MPTKYGFETDIERNEERKRDEERRENILKDGVRLRALLYKKFNSTIIDILTDYANTIKSIIGFSELSANLYSEKKEIGLWTWYIFQKNSFSPVVLKVTLFAKYLDGNTDDDNWDDKIPEFRVIAHRKFATSLDNSLNKLAMVLEEQTEIYTMIREASRHDIDPDLWKE